MTYNSLIIVIIFLILLLLRNKREYFALPRNPKDDYVDDVYKNTQLYQNIDGRLGLDICLEKCTGNCVEDGVTGKAFCFI